MVGVETMAQCLETILPDHPALALPPVHGAAVRVAPTALMVCTGVVHVL
jgi:hypothetical protein